ncbi:MAG TPA: UbiA family prenyltransferase [Chloroflexaceae bacterium]|nr:UbiA family prenyltransferase [Chloroflexaceae bacterium]
MRQLTLDLYHFFRVSASGATLVLPLLGAASAGRGLTGRRAAGLLGVAAAFHAFAYVHNDVCDLEVDRTQPLRAAYPLVRGAVSPRAALAVALGCAAGAFALDAGMGPGRAPARRAHLAAAFGLLAAYNRWGKRCPAPPLTDLAQALGWAALIGYGAAAEGRATRLTGLLAAYEVALIMMVNGVHGALRDLGNDAARGARTTAIMLGAEERPGGGLVVPPALAAYALALQAALLALPLWAAAVNLAGHGPRALAAARGGAGLVAALTLALLGAATRGDARPIDLGMLHLILVLTAPVALAAPGLAPGPRAALLLAHGLPLLANGMTYDAMRWALGLGAPR